MKLLFISDLHGSMYYAEKAVEIFERESADYIVVLGDQLYHGPRNPLTKDYDPAKVAELLNEYSEKIIAVRGNCDSEVDQMLLNYPMMSDYTVILYNNKRIFATHGHIYNNTNIANISKSDVLIYGHTHIALAEKKEGIYLLNPGSIALAKNSNPNSYGVLENNLFEVKDLDGVTFKNIELD